MSLAFGSPLARTDPTLSGTLGMPWIVPTRINRAALPKHYSLLAGPGHGSPAWGKGRVLDCSHSGGWVGEGSE